MWLSRQYAHLFTQRTVGVGKGHSQGRTGLTSALTDSSNTVGVYGPGPYTSRYLYPSVGFKLLGRLLLPTCCPSDTPSAVL